MRTGIGTPLGPSVEILEHSFRTIHTYNFNAVLYYSLPFSYGALHNYLVAKLLWNAQADIPTITEDFLTHAYGANSAAYMGELYEMLDRKMKEYKINSPLLRSDYEMTSDIALKIYAKNYWEIERLYKAAIENTLNDVQKKRLEMFGDDLYILNKVLHSADALPGVEKSIFYLPLDRYQEFLKEKQVSPAIQAMIKAGEQGGITGICLPGKKCLTLPRLKNDLKPRIDGSLDEPAWQYVRRAEQYESVIREFVKFGGTKTAARTTMAMATYDDNNLYVSCRSVDDDINGLEREHDDNGIFLDDCIELFFGMQSEGPGTYWHLVVNPMNSGWDELVLNQTDARVRENLEWESAVEEGDGYWSVEILIPFKSLDFPGTGIQQGELPLAGMTWRVNMTRRDKPSKENSSWASVEGGSVDKFGEFGRWYFSR
jgi:hypothetical protein